MLSCRSRAMRVRSSSAPTVRSRPNQRALSMASATRLDEAVDQLDVALGEVVVALVLDGQQPDDRPSGGEDGVEARRRLGGEARTARFGQVGHADDLLLLERPAQRAGQLVGAHAQGEPGALAAHEVPVAGGVVEHEDGGEVEVEQAPEAPDGGVEDVVEVERRRQGLGDPVEREQQRVGVGEAAEAVEGQRVLAVGLAGDPPGVAGDEGHEQQHQAPLRPIRG